MTLILALFITALCIYVQYNTLKILRKVTRNHLMGVYLDIHELYIENYTALKAYDHVLKMIENDLKVKEKLVPLFLENKEKDLLKKKNFMVLELKERIELLNQLLDILEGDNKGLKTLVLRSLDAGVSLLSSIKPGEYRKFQIKMFFSTVRRTIGEVFKNKLFQENKDSVEINKYKRGVAEKLSYVS